MVDAGSSPSRGWPTRYLQQNAWGLIASSLELSQNVCLQPSMLVTVSYSTLIASIRYTEAITILYSANTFEFRHEINFIYFPPTILPTRMSAIRSLQFRLKISGMLTENSALAYRDRRPTGAPEGALAWKMLWAVVTDMSALRVLNVELEMGSRLDVYTGREIDELLTPLMDVRQTERFVVVIGWVVVGDYRMRELSEKPFEIVEVDPGVG